MLPSGFVVAEILPLSTKCHANFKRENMSNVKMYNTELLTCPVVTDGAFSTLRKDYRRVVRQ